ncbi:MAG: outer membrane protein transport protein [Verrucomicrobia bacterium]|nr:outer membrane protein transport protein [Verrucomicrobiota bacterium]
MKKLSLSLAAFAALAPTSLLALGIRVPDQDPFAIARGNAYIATADNPSAIYYNPAGITQLEGVQTRVGAYVIAPHTDYTSTAGVKSDTANRVGVVPEIYTTWTKKDSKWSFGFGSYSPFGLSLEWPQNTGFRSLALYGSLRHIALNPVVAYQITPGLSIGVGATLNAVNVKLRQGVPGSTGYREFQGEDFEPGYNAGILWKITDQHSLGVTYRSGLSLSFEGDVTVKTPGPTFVNTASANFRLPQVIGAGYSFRPNEKWNFEVDVDWTDWNTLNNVYLNAPVGGGALPFNWQSSFMYMGGVTRYFEHGWRVSGGYLFSQNSVPSVSFNPGVPDSDRHVFSLGLGRTYKSGFSWDLAYQLGYSPTRTVSGLAAPPPVFNANANGKYEFMSHALSFSVGGRF